MRMVNAEDGLDARDREILAALKAAPGCVSGQILADRLGISRVALWKRIERLKAQAFRIEGSNQGYRLLGEDSVAPWAFAGDAPVVFHAETASTMDEAWRLAEGGAPAGTLVIADRQTAGRGRKGRAWTSPAGGLYVTLVLRPRLPASCAATLVLEGACALAEWLESSHGCPLDLHWPNDLMSSGRKIGGLLLEQAGSLETPRFFLLGLGLNRVPVEVPGREIASLAQRMARLPLRRELAMAFRDHMVAWDGHPRVRAWESRCPQIGQALRLQDWRGQVLEGLAEGFDERGALWLSRKNGARTCHLPGEVHQVIDPSPLSA